MPTASAGKPEAAEPNSGFGGERKERPWSWGGAEGRWRKEKGRRKRRRREGGVGGGGEGCSPSAGELRGGLAAGAARKEIIKGGEWGTADAPEPEDLEPRRQRSRPCLGSLGAEGAKDGARSASCTPPLSPAGKVLARPLSRKDSSAFLPSHSDPLRVSEFSLSLKKKSKGKRQRRDHRGSPSSAWALGRSSQRGGWQLELGVLHQVPLRHWMLPVSPVFLWLWEGAAVLGV